MPYEKGDWVRVWWRRGCSWNDSDHPGGRPAQIQKIVTDRGGPATMGIPDVVTVRYGRGDTEHILRGRIREKMDK